MKTVFFCELILATTKVINIFSSAYLFVRASIIFFPLVIIRTPIVFVWSATIFGNQNDLVYNLIDFLFHFHFLLNAYPLGGTRDREWPDSRPSNQVCSFKVQ